MSQPIDVAYVDLVARTKEFRRDIKRVIDHEVKDLENEMTDALDAIDAHFAKTGKIADDVLKDIDATIDEVVDSLADVGGVFDEIDDEVEKLNASLDRHFNRSFRRFNDAWEDMDRRNFAVEALKRIRAGFTDLGDGISSVVQTINQGFIRGITSIPPLLLPIMIALPPLIGLLVSLGAVVSNAAGVLALLPAGLTVLAAIIAPLAIGFNGFGEALGAVMEKDPEKLAEAMKELAPAARTVVKEFQALLPIFTKIGDTVQQALFTPLQGDLTNLIQSIKGPLTGGLANVAFQLGEIISDIADVAASPEGVLTIAQVFQTTADILTVLRPVLTETFTVFLGLIRESLPFIQLFAELFAGALAKFNEFVANSTKTGEFTEFLKSAVNSLASIGALVVSIIKFFGALFTPETVASGQIVLALLTDMFNQFTAFLQSTAGKRFLEDLAILAIGATAALVALLQTFGFVFASITLFVGEFIRLITGAGDILEIWQERAGTTADGIVNAVSSVPQRLQALGASFAAAGLHLIQSFTGGFRKAGNFIDDVAGDIVRGIKSGLNRLIATINSGIANLDAALPFSLARIPQLASGALVKSRPGGSLVNVSEGREDEAILPLSKLEELLKRRGGDDPGSGMTVNFAPGSISIGFDSPPTEGEARAVGAAVGDGIVNQLAKRNVRTQVRAA